MDILLGGERLAVWFARPHWRIAGVVRLRPFASVDVQADSGALVPRKELSANTRRCARFAEALFPRGILPTLKDVTTICSETKRLAVGGVTEGCRSVVPNLSASAR